MNAYECRVNMWFTSKKLYDSLCQELEISGNVSQATMKKASCMSSILHEWPLPHWLHCLFKQTKSDKNQPSFFLAIKMD